MTSTVTGMLLAASAGLNAFLPILILALADRFSTRVDLPQPYNIISSVAGIVILLILVTIDLFADKIPRIDHLNDLINSPVRPAAGMFLMMAAVSGRGEIHEVVAMFIGLLLAGIVHAIKAIYRTRITLATNGLANPVVSLAEDGIAALASVLAVLAPWIGLAVAVPAGVGLGWMYRKFSGTAPTVEQPLANEDVVVLSQTPGERAPKRAVTRRTRTETPLPASAETPDA